MKISNITFGDFCDGFSDSYKNNFSYEGKKALFEYLTQLEEDIGQEIEMDIVAFCCDYKEYDSINEYLEDYDTETTKQEDEEEEDYKERVLEEIQNKTTLIKIENGDSFIIQAY